MFFPRFLRTEVKLLLQVFIFLASIEHSNAITSASVCFIISLFTLKLSVISKLFYLYISLRAAKRQPGLFLFDFVISCEIVFDSSGLLINFVCQHGLLRNFPSEIIGLRFWVQSFVKFCELLNFVTSKSQKWGRI